jgi:hypothetical protein
LVTYLLAIYTIVAIARCVTVDVGEHKVSPEVESGLQTPFTQIDVTIADTENESKQLVERAVNKVN